MYYIKIKEDYKMKEWNKAEITELELKCTEHGSSQTKYIDEVRVETPDVSWYSYSGPAE
jgi:hypothetical protein